MRPLQNDIKVVILSSRRRPGSSVFKDFLDSPVPDETGFAPMKYALHFMGQAFHRAGKPGNDGVGLDSPGFSHAGAGLSGLLRTRYGVRNDGKRTYSKVSLYGHYNVYIYFVNHN